MYNGTPFKTPLPHRTPKSEHGKDFYATGKTSSDSEESVSSNSDKNAESVFTPSSDGEISLVAQFDDIARTYRQIRSSKKETESAFLSFIEQIKVLFVEYYQAFSECKRLQDLVERKTEDCTDLEHKLMKARKLIDQEKLNTRNARKERDDLAIQVSQIRELLLKDKSTSNRLSEEIRHKLSFLQNNNSQNDWNCNIGHPQLRSILSDFSYSRSDEELDGSILQTGKAWKKHRPSSGGIAEPAIKKRRSSGNKIVEIGATDTVRATTTLTVTKDGPITATSIIESVPKGPAPLESPVESYPSVPPANLVFESWARESPRKRENGVNTRQHCFQQKTIVMPDTCGPCEKRIRFGKAALKCKECKAICHIECKDNLPLPCVPVMNTPTQRNILGVIGDYTPTIPPMVPALLIHCINEIELRGLSEIGLYRIPGPERDVKALKEKFLKGKGTPCLNKIDVHIICGVVKDFLRSLNEPLLTYGLWRNFVQTVEAKDPVDVLPAIYQTISQLPPPNRDTLAYMILHLQKISEAKECKMSVSNLAKIFGPTIVGYSSEDPDPSELLHETLQMNIVMEHLINIPSDYWLSFINVENTLPPSRLQQTPSTDSLLRPTITRGLFATPNRNLNLIKRKQKYFASPKH
ncbi:rac GTPase-activating protein 1 [Asbolus verrucosus]|uniref:Rac GTPase-activating protein 1 n=1 Tax=Asbolus verrucosus TaxID=1661398 RepID=A0A482VEZ3_ASBVE|nr:rac GTPase-activating protein 1 [Asbolus verrucosus]